MSNLKFKLKSSANVYKYVIDSIFLKCYHKFGENLRFFRLRRYFYEENFQIVLLRIAQRNNGIFRSFCFCGGAG